MDRSEPPSAKMLAPADRFFVGKDSHGNWVVHDAEHLRGGLFVDRAAALKYVKSEISDRPHTVVMVPEPFELDMRGPTATAQAAKRDGAHGYRRAA